MLGPRLEGTGHLIAQCVGLREGRWPGFPKTILQCCRAVATCREVVGEFTRGCGFVEGEDALSLRRDHSEAVNFLYCTEVLDVIASSCGERSSAASSARMARRIGRTLLASSRPTWVF